MAESAQEKLERMKKMVPEPEKCAGGDSNRITREYLDSMLISYRHIGGKKPSLTFDLFGKTFATPIMLGGMAAMVPGLHEGGMAEMARGVKEAGGVFWSGYIPDEDFAEAVKTGVSAIRIIKPLRDNEAILEAIRHDEECGALAFAIDIDHGFDDYGEYHPAVPHGYGELSPKSAKELAMFADSTSLPFIAKGILSVRDALLAVEAGAKGLLLSHHKGEYPYAVPPLKVLPEIRKAVGGKVKIFVDCGIVSGMDAFKALALGADGVCAARVFLKPFAQDGAKGVAEKLRQMTAELAGVMARTCSPDIQSIDPDVICFR